MGRIRLSDDKNNNEIKPGTVYRSLVMCPTAEGNNGKPQLGDQSLS
jgi:hypothetical protein